MIPTIEKSESQKVVLANPIAPIRVYTHPDRKVIPMPCTNEPNIQPLLPPKALPNTPAVPPQKKCAIILGIKTTVPTAPCMSIATIPPSVLNMYPINTALGA